MLLSCHALLQSALPKAATSLKVLAELPIIVVLMYQVRYPYTIYGVSAPPTCANVSCSTKSSDECNSLLLE